jgi:hypothetical protein
VKRTKILQRLIIDGRQHLNAVVREPACILCTAIGCDVLKTFGIDARPLSVQVDVVNQAWLTWTDDGRPGGPTGGLARGAWAITCGGEDTDPTHFSPTLLPVEPGKAWDGHLVIQVEEGIIDLDLLAFSRPTKNLVLPAAALFAFDAAAGQGQAFQIDGHLIRYQPKPADRSWEATRDWRSITKRQATVDRIVRLIRKGRA